MVNDKTITENQTDKTEQDDKDEPQLDSLRIPKFNIESKHRRESIFDHDNTKKIEVAAQITLPPDGGWGWMVVISSFLIYAITDGIVLTFGCLYRSILTDLDLTPALVSLINSLTVSCGFLFGPVVSAIINRYGFRSCVMVGSAITSTSFFLTFLFGNYASLLLFYGLISGLGIAMINMSALIIIGFYFQRLRGIAFAISVTGSSVGVVGFSQLYAHMVQVVGWRYTVLFQAGLMGLCYFISMNYKPLLNMTVVKTTVTTDKDIEPLTLGAPVLSKITLKSAITSRRTSLDEGNVKLFHANVDFPTAAEVIGDINAEDSRLASAIQMTSGASRLTSTIAIVPLNKKADLHKNELERVRSLLHQVYEERDEDSDKVSEAESPTAKDHSIKIEKTEELEILDDKKNRESSIFLDKKKSTTGSLILDGKRTKSILLDGHRGSVARGFLHWEDHVAEARPMYRDDAFLHDTHSMITTNEAEQNPLEYQLKVSRVATSDDLKERKGLCTTAFTRVLFTMLDPTLLKRKSCICVFFSMLMYYAAFLIPLIYVNDRGQELGIPLKYSAWFLSAVGIAGLCGRFFTTFLAMWLNPVQLISALFITAGVSTLLSVFGNTGVLQLVYCTILGLCTAGTGAMRTIIFAKLYGLEKLTNCTGIVYVFQGVGSLISPPLAGVLKRVWNQAPFIYSGVCFIIGGSVLLPVMALVKKEDEAIEKNRVVS